MTVYFVRCGDTVKVGYVKHDVEKRLKQLQTGNHEEFVLIGQIPGTTRDEAAIHRQLKRFQIRREWFAWSDEVEGLIKDIITEAHKRESSKIEREIRLHTLHEERKFNEEKSMGHVPKFFKGIAVTHHVRRKTYKDRPPVYISDRKMIRGVVSFFMSLSLGILAFLLFVGGFVDQSTFAMVGCVVFGGISIRFMSTGFL